MSSGLQKHHLMCGYMVALLLFAQSVQAQGNRPFWSATPGASQSENARVRLSESGHLQFAGAPQGRPFETGYPPNTDPETVARAFLLENADALHTPSTKVTFTPDRLRTVGNRNFVRLNQHYDTLPVFAAQVVVQAQGARIESVSADIAQRLESLENGQLSTAPGLSGSDAEASARTWAQREFLDDFILTSMPDLYLYDPTVVGNDGPLALVWKLRVTGDAETFIDEEVFIDAHTGKLLFHFSHIHDARNRRIYDANNTEVKPAVPNRAEGAPATGVTQIDEAYDYLGDTYDFYNAEHGRDSINGLGMPLDAIVRWCQFGCPMQNAFWWNNQMWFGDGFQIDDVAGHELTHGVTENESGLIYANQSGAINESFSDMWGEWIDQTNGAGLDNAASKWYMGEEIGAIRYMKDPTEYGHPDRMGSPLFYTGTEDSGGVHFNSGVGNKLCYLLTDGDFFNGYAVDAMGISTTADLMYECQTNLLTQGSDYDALYDALTQAAINLGFNQADRANVENACRAVEIKLIEGVSGFGSLSEDGMAQIDLSWTNPLDAQFTEVRVRRSTVDFPQDPDNDGILLYQGNGTSYSDSSVTLDTTYYYTIWAYHGPLERSPSSTSRTTAGLFLEYYTEHFTSDLDLGTETFVFTPNGSGTYEVCGSLALGFPTDISSGNPITQSLSDDDYKLILLTNGQNLKLFEEEYIGLFLNSNGRLTFSYGDPTFIEDLTVFYEQPGIAGLFHDLDPSSGGSIITQQFFDKFVVTFINVPEFFTDNSNTFQIELFYDGVITITYLTVNAQSGIVGLSDGYGLPNGFFEKDLSGAWDADGDQLGDCWEEEHGLDPTSATGDDGADGDADGDGLSNIFEAVFGTNPTNSDTDDDGFSDGLEIDDGTDPANSGSYTPKPEVWVQMDFSGDPRGSNAQPVTTLGEAAGIVADGGVIKFKAGGYSNEFVMVDRQVTVHATNGTVTIGAGS